MGAEDLFEQHHPRAKALVNTYCTSINPFVAYLRQDIESEAMIGLWQACQRFKETTNNTFWSFAQLRVRGAILDFLRRERIQVRSDGKDGWGGVAIQIVPLPAGLDSEDHDMTLADKRSEAAISSIESRISIDKSIKTIGLSDKEYQALMCHFSRGDTVRNSGIGPLIQKARMAAR